MIRLIAAIDARRGLARDDTMPWHLPEDVARMRQLLEGKDVLVGQKTLESFGKHLPVGATFFTAHRGMDFPAFFAEHPDAWVAGGEQVYAATIAYADELYLTEIAQDYNCDKFFPEYQQDFALVQQEPRDGYTYSVYQRHTL